MFKLKSFLSAHRIKLAVFGLVLLGVLIVGVFLVNKNQTKDPLSASLKQKAGFALYYPAKLPGEFRFDEVAYDPGAKVVTYSYSATGGKKLYFSQQKKPDNFNYDDFRTKNLAGSTQVDTSIGMATIGLLQSQTTSSIITDDTWILISVGGNINIDQLKEVSQNLVKSGAN